MTNLVSTMPEGWPVEVVFESNGRERKAWVRLTDLPYGPVTRSKPAAQTQAPTQTEARPAAKDRKARPKGSPRHRKSPGWLPT